MYVFGYGSLLWYTDFPYVQAIPGVVLGYVRRFWCLSPEHRGTPEKPGRVVSLVPEKKGSVWGVAYKVPDEAVESTIQYLNFREKAGYQRMKVKFWPDNGSDPFELYVYIVHKENIYFDRPANEDEIVSQILQCSGKSGSNLEYALRLADCQRRMAPSFKDEHLFTIELRLLRLCRYLNHKDEILEKLYAQNLEQKSHNEDTDGKENQLKVLL